MRWRGSLLVVLFWLASLCAGRAQQLAGSRALPFDAKGLGDEISLDHGWLFHAGDDPTFPDPGLDDREWTPIDLQKPLATYGVPPTLRFGWLRLHVHLPLVPQPLVLGLQLSHGRYQAFANGRLIGAAGNLADHTLYERNAITQLPLAPELLSAQAGDLVLALRFSLQTPVYVGAGPETPFLGGAVLLGGERSLREDDIAHSILNWGELAINVVPAFLTGLVALALFAALPRHREYLFLALYSLLNSLDHLLLVVSWVKPFALPVMFALYIPIVGSSLAFTEFVRELLSLRRTLAIHMIWTLLLLSEVPILLWAAGMTPASVAFSANIASYFLFFLGLAILIVRSGKLQTPDARLLLISILPAVVNGGRDVVSRILLLVHQATPFNNEAFWSGSISVGPFHISYNTLADLFLELSLLVFLVLRTVRIALERNRIASEIEAARSVQHILIPEELPSIPGLAIATAYHPAQEVGGDFFQILALAGGQTLIVLGDVAGKGLSAAMTVSLLVGSLRSVAEFTHSPAEILSHLNARLLGRGSGFTTCLVMRIDRGDASASMTLANAGHLPPYLNGVEVETPPALPLGITDGIGFVEQSRPLACGDSLTLLTDGVPEAANQQRELLGFARTLALSREPAARIAEAARAFGQNDDITVLSISITA